jgi:hypothetical protein
MIFITYTSPNVSRIFKLRNMRLTGHVARMGKKMNAYSVLVGKAEEKKPLRRLKLRWKNDIKIEIL